MKLLKINNKKRSLFLLLLSFYLMSALARLFGLVKDILFINIVNIGSDSDQFQFLLGMPMILLNFLSISVTTTLIPFLQNLKKKIINKKYYEGLLNSFLYLFIFFGFLISIFYGIYISNLFGLNIITTIISLIILILYSINIYFTILHYIYDKIKLLFFSQIFINIPLIILMFFSKTYSINIFLLAFIFGQLLELIIKIIFLKHNFLTITFDKTIYLSIFKKLTIPIIGSIFFISYTSIEKSYLLTIYDGYFTFVNLSILISSIPHFIFVNPIIQSHYSFFNQHQDSPDELRKNLSKAIIYLSILFAFLAATIFLYDYLFIFLNFLYSNRIPYKNLDFRYTFFVVFFTTILNGFRDLFDRFKNSINDNITPVLYSSIIYFLSALVLFIYMNSSYFLLFLIILPLNTLFVIIFHIIDLIKLRYLSINKVIKITIFILFVVIFNSLMYYLFIYFNFTLLLIISLLLIILVTILFKLLRIYFIL